ncbi:MAG: sigma-70 family RNA polymerase sigma factor [Coriobacteriia bacterium]|nr:sigma-70 family RNA polymerase sigma factor [Coriobacteriia bacterium]
MHTIGDAELVQLARHGDTAAYGELFERWQSKVFNFAYGIVGNAEDASDVTQDAFVRVYESLPRLTELKFGAYVYRTARNLAYDVTRTRGRRADSTPLDFEVDESIAADPERIALLREQQTQVREAAGSLSDEYRSVLELREVQDLSYQEIADAMEMPRNTVGVYLSRARLKFKGAFRMAAVDADRLSAECQQMLPLLSAYIDNELNADERDDVDRHLDGCPLCRWALDEMREASRSYRCLLPLIPPAGIASGLFGRIEEAGAAELASGGVPDADSTAVISDTPLDAGAPIGRQGAAGRSGPGRFSRRQKIALVLSGTAIVVGLGLGTYGLLAASEPTEEADYSPSERRESSTPVAESTSGVFSSDRPTAEFEPKEPGLETSDADGTGTGPDTTAPPAPELISPADSWQTADWRVELWWRAIEDPSGVLYTVEVEAHFMYGSGSGWVSVESASGLRGTSYSLDMPAQTIRWRVYATDGAGNEGPPSEWRSISLVDPSEGTSEETTPPPY